jgi:hypothetical protein
VAGLAALPSSRRATRATAAAAFAALPPSRRATRTALAAAMSLHELRAGYRLPSFRHSARIVSETHASRGRPQVHR